MTDYLLVHGAGQGAWSWGSVWGYLTAPEEHPPTLHKPRRANRVHPLDLPGLEQQAEPEVVHAGVVAHASQPLDSLLLQRQDQILRDTTEAESTHQEGTVVGDVLHGLRRRRNHLGGE